MAADIENKICEAVEIIVNKAMSNANYDKTIVATIVSCADESIGKYKCNYQNSVFYAYSLDLNQKYKYGNEVYILIPNNDTSKIKTIIGTVEKTSVAYSTEVSEERYYNDIGNNSIISNSSFNLSSYQDKLIVLYEKNGQNNLLEIDEKGLKGYITESNVLKCGGSFKTALPLEQTIKGNYGIVFELMFIDNASGDLVKRNYVFDVNQMIGNPYNLTEYTQQYGYFEIDGSNYQYINKIYIFDTGFPNKNLSKPDDIFIKDILITGANKIEEIADVLTVKLSTPDGSYFDNSDAEDSIKTLKAISRVRGNLIDENSGSLKYYWFKENIEVDIYNEKYCPYGGEGWECLNSYNQLKQDVVEWVPATSNIYSIQKNELTARQTKFKVVVIYDENLIASQEVSILNYTANFEINISSDMGLYFYYDIGYPTLTCNITTDQVIDETKIKYVWCKIDNNNNYISLPETTENNTIYNNAVTAYEELLQEIENEEVGAAASQQQLNNYLTIINNYDTITRVENKYIHKIAVKEIVNFCTYKCSVYYNNVLVGSNSVILTNDIKPDEVKYDLILNNGEQTYKYSGNGISPANENLEKPIILLPLTFDLYDNLGNILKNEYINQNEIKWVVPKKATMLEIPHEFDSYIEEETEDSYIYSGLYELNYNIRNIYSIDKTNNIITLKVNYKGKDYISSTNLSFIKEGEQGTNGTDFYCKIVPNTTENVKYPIIINGQLNYETLNQNVWFKAQLWHNGEKIFDNFISGNSLEGKNVSLYWSVLKNKYTSSIEDNSEIEIGETSGVCSYTQGLTATPANIIKCVIKYDGISYYATLPVVTIQLENNYKINIPEKSGFKYVTYTSDGRIPSYDNNIPFEIDILKLIDGYYEEYSHKAFYFWETRGKVYNGGSWINNSYLAIRNYISGLKNNQKKVKPVDNFDGLCLNNSVYCEIYEDEQKVNLIAKVNIPVHLFLNRNGISALNDWDGNSVSIDEDGGVILSPQIGAGQKNINDNTFTGMLMGKVKESGKTIFETGLFGYNHGLRTLFIDAEDGSAIFGKTGIGQLIVDPSQDKALLYSSGYWKQYDNKGKPLSYGTSNENGAGMLIDLTTPCIKWGNGNFSVDANGCLIAKNATFTGDIIGASTISIGDYLRINNQGEIAINDPTGTGMSGDYWGYDRGVLVTRYETPGIAGLKIKQLLNNQNTGKNLSIYFNGIIMNDETISPSVSYDENLTIIQSSYLQMGQREVFHSSAADEPLETYIPALVITTKDEFKSDIYRSEYDNLDYQSEIYMQRQESDGSDYIYYSSSTDSFFKVGKRRWTAVESDEDPDYYLYGFYWNENYTNITPTGLSVVQTLRDYSATTADMELNGIYYPSYLGMLTSTELKMGGDGTKDSQDKVYTRVFSRGFETNINDANTTDIHNYFEYYMTDKDNFTFKHSRQTINTKTDNVILRGNKNTKLLGAYTLYSNSAGNSGTVVLSDNVSNYDYIEIFYLSTSDSGTGYAQNSTRVWQPQGKSAFLSTGYVSSSSYNIKIASVLLSNTTISKAYGYWEFNANSESATNYVGITKVIGYK